MALSEDQKMILKFFTKPAIIGVVSGANSGKSMLLYHMYETLKEAGSFNLYTYGLELELSGSQTIFSVEEMEQVKDSLLILDEANSLFDLEQSRARKQIEQFMRLLFHNNNIVIMSLLPDNIKKFLANNIHIFMYKRCVINQFIQGSAAKRIVENFSGPEKGNTVLDVPIDETLVFDGKHYSKIKVPYMEQYDTKADNKPIINLNPEVQEEMENK